MDKHTVIDRLEQMGVLLELAGENVFKVRAYTNGARALESFEGDMADPAAIAQVKGIGKGLAADIQALVTTGRLAAYDELMAKTPPGLLEILALPGLGPKKVKAIHEGLGLASVGELEYACLENRLVDLPGFGEKTQAKILKSIEVWKSHRGRCLYADALDPAMAIERAIAGLPGVGRVAIAGEMRRKLETLDRVVWVASAADPAPVLAALARLPGLEAGTQVAGTRASGQMENGLACELVVVEEALWPVALLYETGSPAFLAGLEQRAASRGLALGPTGLTGADGSLLAVADEAALLAHLGLAVVPPELREDERVIALAATNSLPRLVVEGDLQGIFHVHTRYSDGEASIREMALAARGLGYHYIGISDHSEAAFYARGLRRDRLIEQQAEIRALNAELEGITILAGIEADILADGALDYDDETLASFDFVIGSVHSRFGQDRDAMTARLVKAVSHPRLTMLGHMTGRLLLSREAYAFDLPAVLAAAARHGKVIELNANPHRLDIDWRDVPAARALDLPIAISPDAHSPGGLNHTRFGVAVARKGGLGPEGVFNAWPLERVQAYLAQARAAAAR